MDKKTFKSNYFTYTLTLISLALVGSAMLTPSVRNWLQKSLPISSEIETDNSPILELATLSEVERENQLQAIATQTNVEGARARYILASRAIAQTNPEPALTWLDNLENKHFTLAPYILFKRGQAYQQQNNIDKTTENWQKILKNYPQSPIRGEILYQLGQIDPQYWEQIINELPHHPRTQEIIRQKLQDNPNQPELMLILLKHSPTDINEIRNTLTTQYSQQLTPQDWQIIAESYWQTREYGQAALAYDKAPNTPENQYRRARGRELSGQATQARTIYQNLVQNHPREVITATALRNLARLSQGMETINYLDAIIANFPEQAPDALLEKANVLDRLRNSQAATQARQTLLNKYPQASATAQYRWEKARELAEKGNLDQAWTWGQPILTNNPNSSVAAKAGFWLGKWAQQLNKAENAETAFKFVLRNHPQSYYAWRAAVNLGWDVGDFTTVRNLNPEIVQPPKSIPPAGSELFQELYLLGEYDDAWNLLNAEVSAKDNLSVAEAFTKGLLLKNQGKYLSGIGQIFDLQNRTDTTDIAQWQALRQTPEYWYALFPFPYQDLINKYANQRQLNPLLVTSLIRQESRFEKDIESSAGALGLMQVMPATAQWISDQTNIKEYSLTNPEDNVNLGTWYFDYTHNRYNNNSMLAIASYNAGPGNVNNWIQRFGPIDNDTFVEKIPFPETKGYVEAVFGNYWNYQRLYNPQIQQLLLNLK